MTMKFKTADELRDHIWQELDLDNHSLLFGVLDIGDDEPHILPGMFDCSGDLWDDSEFYDIALSYCNDPEIHVDLLETYMIGNGEAEHAYSGDCEYLADVAKESPSAWNDFLNDIADCLCTLKDFNIENPAYEKPYDAGWCN